MQRRLPHQKPVKAIHNFGASSTNGEALTNQDQYRGRKRHSQCLQAVEVKNLYQQKFPDMKDFPYSQKVSIFEAGSLIGEDDLFEGR